MTGLAEPMREVYCPHCSYDLRGQEKTSSIRCPECGKQYDAAELSATRVPWIQRIHIGRIRAFTGTIRLVTFHTDILACTANDDDRAAATFRWLCTAGFWAITSLVYLVTPSSCWMWPVTYFGGRMPNNSVVARWWIYPWSAAAGHWWLALPVLLGFWWSLALLPARLVGFARFSQERRMTLLRASQYLVAGIIGGAITGIGVTAVLLLWYAITIRSVNVLPATGVLPAVCVPGTGMFLWQWAVVRFFVHARATAERDGWLLLALWPLALVVVTAGWLVLLPWCVGLTWLAIVNWLA